MEKEQGTKPIIFQNNQEDRELITVLDTISSWRNCTWNIIQNSSNDHEAKEFRV